MSDLSEAASGLFEKGKSLFRCLRLRTRVTSFNEKRLGGKPSLFVGRKGLFNKSELADDFTATFGSQSTPDAVWAAIADHSSDTQIASVDVLGDKADRAVCKHGLNTAGVHAAGREHPNGTVSVSIAIIDAGRTVWWSDRVEGVNFRLAIAPDGAESSLDCGTGGVTVALTNCCGGWSGRWRPLRPRPVSIPGSSPWAFTPT